jgi:Spy/CpxP family protein refolding chaperone
MNRRGLSGRWLAAIMLLMAALVGGLTAVAVDRLVLMPYAFPGGHGPGGRFGGPPPGDRGFRDRFAQEVGLSAEQQRRIDSIMDGQGRELQRVRSQIQPRLDSIISGTRRQFDAVLTPEQRVKAEAFRKRHPPPPGGPPGGRHSLGGEGPPPGRPPC